VRYTISGGPRMNFIGRKDESKAIAYSLAQKGYQGILVSGRRRIGKTELIKHCCSLRYSRFLYFQCTDDNETNNAAAFSKLISAYFSLPALSFTRIKDALEFVFSLAEKEEVCLIIDEYPYLEKVVPGLDSIVQAVIDGHIHTANLKFFLSGSSVSVMNSLLAEGKPLYHRFQLSIFLKEQDYFEAAQYYPSFSDEDKVRLYSAFGGVPYYLSQIDPHLSVKENIILLLSGRFARLADEATHNLKNELLKITNANSVFSVIARGYSRFSDILSQSHVSSSSLLSVVLDALISMDLVRKKAPINDENNNQKYLYSLSDRALAFYYRYVFGNESSQAILSENAFYDSIIAEDFESVFVPRAFEDVAREYLIRENKEGRLNPPLLSIGTFWYDDKKTRKNGQFDVVGKSGVGYSFYEVKFTKNPLNDKDLASEASQIQAAGLPVSSLGFVSRSGYSLKGTYPYSLLTLADLYRSK
jgi:uncharacterized protein